MILLIEDVLEEYKKSFSGTDQKSFVTTKWEEYLCDFAFKIELFEGSGKILINSKEIRVIFFADEDFYWDKEVREDFRSHLKKYIDSSVRKIRYKLNKIEPS